MSGLSAELAREPALNDAAEFQLRRDASIGTSRRGASASVSSPSSSPPDELELDQCERGGTSSSSPVFGATTRTCGTAERNPGRATRGGGVARCAAPRRARLGIGATTVTRGGGIAGPRERVCMCAGAGDAARSRSRTGRGTALIWRGSSPRAAAMLTLSLRAAARLRAWCVGRCALRTAAASSVYRRFAVRRTCRRAPTCVLERGVGVDMAESGLVWEFVAVVGSLCRTHCVWDDGGGKKCRLEST